MLAIATLFGAVVMMGIPGEAIPASECADYQSGVCEVDNDGTGLGVGGERDTGGSPGNPGDDGDSGGDDGGSGGDADVEAPIVYPDNPELCMGGPRAERLPQYCSSPNVVPGEDPLPVITIRDLVRFVPADSTIAGEPNNLGVAGLATNFVANAQTTIVEATLFDHLISVEFTPIEYDFDYGDGAAASHATGGASWQSLGLAQFTPTDTSHVYLDRGTYTASITVDYTARINFGFGWLPVDGTVTGPPATQDIQIFEARTALVDRTCDEDANAAGC